MAHMTDAQWQRYINTINEWQEDAFQQEFTWKRAITRTSRYGEDINNRYEYITLKGLIHYNNFRSWPVNMYTDTGELDKQSIMVFLNIAYLNNLGYSDEHGVLKYDPGFDKFIINGIVYVNAGESQVSQAKDEPILSFIILKREETDTGNNFYGN